MADMDTRGAKRRNKRWPEALKREIVAATFVPGASVSAVARRYDVNANQVSGWRRRFCDANERPASSSPPLTPGLVPVMIMPGPISEPVNEAATQPAPAASDTIEIEVSGDCRIRVGSNFDGKALKRVLDVLRRR